MATGADNERFRTSISNRFGSPALGTAVLLRFLVYNGQEPGAIANIKYCNGSDGICERALESR